MNLYRLMLCDICNKEITINGEKKFIGVTRALANLIRFFFPIY